MIDHEKLSKCDMLLHLAHNEIEAIRDYDDAGFDLNEMLNEEDLKALEEISKDEDDHRKKIIELIKKYCIDSE